MIAALALATVLAFADSTGTPSPADVAPADCSLVDETAAARILGFAVQAPDEASRAGGTCLYSSSDISEDGSLAYTIVTAASLPQRRAAFRAYARRCAPAAPGTSGAMLCKQFLALAQANDLAAYFAARTASGDPEPVPDLGSDAIATGDALYIKRAGAVYELAVMRAGDFDLARTTDLAHALLDRTKAHP